MSSLLELKNISKSFGATKALTDMNFSLEKGEIHALVGENGAGKSTLINILAGIHQPDCGEIIFEGEAVTISGSSAATEFGIAVIHQELLLCDTLSAAENVFLGCLPGKGLVSWEIAESETKKYFDMLDLNISPDICVNRLTAAQKQMVEICKAISKNCRILIMDEPTSALTETDTAKLLRVVEKLKANGISVIYISHKLEEVMEISDRITVIRDGLHIKTLENKGVEREEIVRLMVGREISDFYIRNNKPTDEIIFEVKGLCGDAVKGADFYLKKGEILGFSGLIGAGRSELMSMVFGIDRHTDGEMILEGKALKIKSPRDAVAAGIVMVPEDRKVQGLFLKLSISFNYTIANLKAIISRLKINTAREKETFGYYKDKLGIKMADQAQVVGALSGGNQQKVLISRWLFLDPKIIILDEPTKGIDVGAKADIYRLLDELTAAGVSVILVSSELPEIIGMCDRVYVMHERKVMRSIEKADMTQANIMNVATGGN